MLKSIELNSHIRNRLAEYLKGRGMDFQTAMQEEKGNKEIAAIVHSGLPTLVRKLYSEQKMQKFFWEKRDLIADYISRRMQGWAAEICFQASEKTIWQIEIMLIVIPARAGIRLVWFRLFFVS